jgi:hypothetical protein
LPFQLGILSETTDIRERQEKKIQTNHKPSNMAWQRNLNAIFQLSNERLAETQNQAQSLESYI